MFTVSVFTILISSSISHAVYDPKIEGCKFFCKQQFGEGTKGYDNCIVQTQTEGKCGSSKKSVTLPTNVPIPTARPTDESAAGESSCKQEFEKLLSACESSTSETAETCDENNSGAMKNASNNAQVATQGDNQAVQYACGQAGNISQNAKSALQEFRKNCSDSLDSCRNSCQELSSFLRENKTCVTELGYSQSAASTMADSRMRSCETYQTQVDDADKSISNYNATNAGSAACQAAAQGMSSPQEAKAENEKKTFCDANPNYPGCASMASTDCNNPTIAATNKVCICSKDPNDAACRGSQNAESTSLASTSIDSSSRLPSAKTDADVDIPSLPNVPLGEKPKSGDSADVGGRQGSGSPVGNSSGMGAASKISGSGGGSTVVEPGAGPTGGSYGTTGAGGQIALVPRASDGGRAAGASGGGENSRDGQNQSPDLRQFLPGGIRDPNRMQGSANVTGLDGITGPHSDQWKKIRNRYKVLEGSLEP